jgi:putative ABC transport system permease protein
MPYLSGIQVHWGVLAFNFGVAGIAGILFGLAPALDATKRELHQSLKESARASGGVSHRRMRGLLVVSEVALVLVVLTGAGLTLRSLAALFEHDPGFQAEHLIALDVDLPGQKYEKAPQMASFWKQLLEQVRALPGVQSAGTTSRLPLAGGGNTIRLYAQGRPVPPPGSENEANIREVSPGYFQTMGIPLLAGRSVDQQDEQGKQRVCVLNQDLAKRLFGEEDPVGRSIVFTFNKSEWRIVGVVGNAEFDTLDGRGNPAIYTSVLQDADDYATLIVRTSSTPSAMVPAIRDTVKAIDPDVPVFAVRTIDDIIAATPSIFFRKYLSVLLGGFALLGMLLAAVGIFGVMSYGVTQRTREFGIRAALGAARGDVLRLVMAGGMKLALTGVALGLAGSLAVGRAMQTVLFGVEPYDPLTFAGVSVLLLGVAVLACLVPARRATKIDPMVALRYE